MPEERVPAELPTALLVLGQLDLLVRTFALTSGLPTSFSSEFLPLAALRCTLREKPLRVGTGK